MRSITGWALSCLLAALLVLGSARGKFFGGEAAEAMFTHIGWTADTMFWVGVAEVAFALLLLIPRTAFLGAVLLTAYFGGASAAHIRVDDAFAAPMVIGALAWVAVGLRDPRVFRLAFAGPATTTPPAASDAG